MPELPEVETTVRQLKNAVVGKTLRGFWTDWPKYVRPLAVRAFTNGVVGRKILGVERRGKNILLYLSGGKVLLIHQKLSGHLLVGKWEVRGGKWESKKRGPLDDRVNTYIHAIFDLSNGDAKRPTSRAECGGKQLALSDLRKFGKVRLYSSSEVEKLPELKLGPEALGISYNEFDTILKKRKTRIKALLLDQSAIAGIGNIYSDEILWRAKVHPLKSAGKLSKKEKRAIFSAIPKVLNEAIRRKGTSIDDYRHLDGRSGTYGNVRKVYQQTGKPCPRCKTPIKRGKLGGRSFHYCPKEQKF